MTSASRFQRRLGLAAVVLIASALKGLGCGSEPGALVMYGSIPIQPCDDDAHCAGIRGAHCAGGEFCLCDDPKLVPCCLSPTPGSCGCHPEEECHGAGDSSGDVGGAVGDGGTAGGGGTGGTGGEAQVSECSKAADCPGPADARCGFAMCAEGKCGVVIKPGPTDSQKRGDCKTVYCNTDGTAEEKQDMGDFYNDGRQCTLDICDVDGAKNESYPDGLTCPEAGAGVCYKGQCAECVFDEDCPVNGDLCDGFYCVSMTCVVNDACGPGCRPCLPLKGPCSAPEHCTEGVCTNGKCALPTCQDGVKNDGETGVDCGAQSCASKCPDNQGCAAHEDCLSGVCWGSVCQAPTCTDGVQNGEEGGVDCGAGCPVICTT